MSMQAHHFQDTYPTYPISISLFTILYCIPECHLNRRSIERDPCPERGIGEEDVVATVYRAANMSMCSHVCQDTSLCIPMRIQTYPKSDLKPIQNLSLSLSLEINTYSFITNIPQRSKMLEALL